MGSPIGGAGSALNSHLKQPKKGFNSAKNENTGLGETFASTCGVMSILQSRVKDVYKNGPSAQLLRNTRKRWFLPTRKEKIYQLWSKLVFSRWMERFTSQNSI